MVWHPRSEVQLRKQKKDVGAVAVDWMRLRPVAFLLCLLCKETPVISNVGGPSRMSDFRA